MLFPKLAIADETKPSLPQPNFSFSLKPAGANSSDSLSMNALHSYCNGFSVVELNRSIEQIDDAVTASYEIGLVKPDSIVAPLAISGGYSDPLVKLAVEIEYRLDGNSDISSSHCKIEYATATVTETNLLVTGPRTHIAYAGILGARLAQNTFYGTYSLLKPDWGWVPYVKTGLNPAVQNGTRASFEAWPAGMESSKVLVEAIAEF